MQWLVLASILSRVIFSNGDITRSAISCVIGFHHDSFFTDTEDLFNITNNAASIEQFIKFELFTREELGGKKISFKSKESLKASSFNPKWPTRIITHGYTDRGSDPCCVGPKNAFLLEGDFNVIIMDWYKYQTTNKAFPIYSKVVKKVKPVGLYLAEMIDFLEAQGMNLETTALIGHSLGAHIMGIAGFHATNTVNHIIGLDPAEPSFKNKGPGERISTDDAKHVEIIHSNGGHCGMSKAVGHYDFYVNGGTKQPGCKINSCSHSRVYAYYAESIRSDLGFYGKRCVDFIGKESCNGEHALMGGLERTPIEPGTYYVKTNARSPFATGRPNTV